MRRTLLLGGAAVAILAVAGTAVWYFYAQDTLPRTSAQGMLVSATHDEFTITTREGAQQTFKSNEDTLVYSYVKEGETAKSLSQFPPNTHVIVFLTQADGSVSHVQTAPPLINPAKYGTSFYGTVQAASASSLTVVAAQGEAVLTYALSGATEVLSLALAGETGHGAAGLAEGMRVSVFGKEEATLIIVLPPDEPPQE